MSESAAAAPLVSETGSGRLTLSTLPRLGHSPDVDDQGRLVVREASTYRFTVEVPGRILRIEPSELFDYDDESHRTGRFVPGEAVGLVSIRVDSDGGTFRATVDVRAAKFADEQAFGEMLSDLAALSVESIHQGFAASAGQYGSDATAAPTLLYQQFAVLSAIIHREDFKRAIELVIHRPHRDWLHVEHGVQAGRPVRGSSALSRQISRPGARVLTASSFGSLPRTIMDSRAEETLDTVANRFVRFTLERWRALASAILDHADGLRGAPARRGLEEAQGLVNRLDEILSEPLFREVGALRGLPGDNQVLLRREGYRQILAAAAVVDGSLGLDLRVADPFLVSRRSVATLYEYWVFVRLAKAVANLCGDDLSSQPLFRATPEGMSLVLAAGATSRLRFLMATTPGERVLLDLFFNREFRTESWTRAMRPDASLLIRRPNGPEVWLHFDAKYRVDWTVAFETGEVDEEETAERLGTSKRTDLLKMHAYRDAIRSSAGSYVIFPGSQPAAFNFHRDEFLPGLGAFPLRPERVDSDVDELTRFLRRAVQHVAADGTRHRRATFWTERAYAGPGTVDEAARPPEAGAPPADTLVLVGYVRSAAQWDWVEGQGLYNIRGSGRRGGVGRQWNGLDAELLLLHGAAGDRRHLLMRRVGAWEPATSSTLARLGYPHPRGDEYLLTRVAPLPAPDWLSEVRPGALAPPSALPGEPFSLTWLDLVLSTQVP